MRRLAGSLLGLLSLGLVATLLPSAQTIHPAPLTHGPVVGGVTTTGDAVFARTATAVSANVLLVSWDGSHPLEVQDLLAKGQMPTLQGLLTQGAQWHDLVITEQLPDATVTKPGHAQMLTGLPKTITGVIDNNNWQVIPIGLTLHEQWKAAGAKVGIVVQKAHLAPFPEGKAKGPLWNVWQIADCQFQAGKGGPGTAVNRGLDCLAQFGSSRFFLLVHSKQPDESGHATGAGSTKYRSMLIANDAALARLLAALPPNTQVVITTDHGFGEDALGNCPRRQGEGHRACPMIWAVSFPPLPLAGDRLMDLAPALRPSVSLAPSRATERFGFAALGHAQSTRPGFSSTGDRHEVPGGSLR